MIPTDQAPEPIRFPNLSLQMQEKASSEDELAV